MWYVIIALILAVFGFTNFILPQKISGPLFYLAYSLSWLLLTLLTVKISRSKNIKLWITETPLVTTAAAVALIQIVALVFAGIFSSFGSSPYAFTPLAIIFNVSFFLSTLVGIEVSRAFLVRTYSRRKPTLVLGLTALLYTVISIPRYELATLDVTNPQTLTKFLASSFTPVLAESMFATYLAFLAGLTPALIYRGIITSFMWLCPILPDPSWSVKALIYVMIPTVGFLSIEQATAPRVIRKRGRKIKVKKKSSFVWMSIAMLSVLAVWASTGLLGFRPTVIISGSMRPTIDVGDITITVKTPPESIKPGDIIQFVTEDAIIVHRVHGIQYEGDTRLFVTKGDANNAPDPDPVHPSQVLGKLIFTIPKLGWVSIAVKTFFAEAYTFFTTNLIYSSITLAITLAASILGIHRYRNQPLRKLRRRLGR